jgi:hypothetical protein
MQSLASKVSHKVNLRCSWWMQGHAWHQYKKIYDEIAKEFGYVRKYRSSAEQVQEILHPTKPEFKSSVPEEQAPNYPVWENEIAAEELKNRKS